jgi:hypothetical protein
MSPKGLQHNFGVIYYAVRWASDSVQADLDAAYAMDGANGLYLDGLFDLLEESDSLRLALAEGRFTQIKDPRFDAAPIEWARRWGYNVYYLKMWRADGALLPVRLIYAVNHQPSQQAVWVLGLMPRGDNYDEHSEFAERIRRDYDDHGIPRWRAQ